MVGPASGLRPEASPAHSSTCGSSVPDHHPPSVFFLGSCYARHGSFLIIVHHPHARFIDLLTYKAALVGIRVLLTEESYTSQASFLDGDPLPTYDPAREEKPHFSGKRDGRWYRASGDRLIPSCVNGAYNIARKVVPTAFGRGDRGSGSSAQAACSSQTRLMASTVMSVRYCSRTPYILLFQYASGAHHDAPSPRIQLVLDSRRLAICPCKSGEEATFEQFSTSDAAMLLRPKQASSIETLPPRGLREIQQSTVP
jgi:hypothetical protein